MDTETRSQINNLFDTQEEPTRAFNAVLTSSLAAAKTLINVSTGSVNPMSISCCTFTGTAADSVVVMGTASFFFGTDTGSVVGATDTDSVVPGRSLVVWFPRRWLA